MHLNVWPPGGQLYLVSQTLKWPKMGVIRDQNGVKLGRVGSWPLQKVPFDLFGFLATRGRVYFVSNTLKRSFREL